MNEKIYTHQTPPDRLLFQKIYSLLTDAFPQNEYRPFSAQYALFHQPAYCLYTRMQEDEIVALMGMWKMDDFLFIEHIAVSNHLRGQGIGSQILKKFALTKQKHVILEVEPPQTETAKRRIAFYERLGFHLNTYYYEQPAYYPDQDPFPLFLMSYPYPLNTSQFEKVKQDLYQKIYGIQ